MRLEFFQVTIVFAIWGCLSLPVDMIGCFVCSSINNSTSSCEDTFNNTHTPSYYIKNCFAGRKNRNGAFPATDCIKLKAEGWNTKSKEHETIVVRACVVDNGGINSDTEIGRSNHCGLVNKVLLDPDNDNNYDSYHGCVVSCNTDGCNSAVMHAPSRGSVFYIGSAITLLLVAFNPLR